jgi:hypothetical protein
MPILQWGDISAVGAGSEAGERYLLSEYTGVSLSLLPMWKDVQALPGWHDRSGSDRTIAAICGDLLEIRVELSRGEYNPEWLEDRIMSNDGLAGCPGAE